MEHHRLRRAQRGVVQAGVERFQVLSPAGQSPHGGQQVPGLGGADHPVDPRVGGRLEPGDQLLAVHRMLPRDGLQEAAHYLGGLGGIRRAPRSTAAAAYSRAS